MGQPGLAGQLTPVQPLCPHPPYELRDINAPIYRPIRKPICKLICKPILTSIHQPFPTAGCRARDPEPGWPAVGDGHRAAAGSPGNYRWRRP
jgi:hypothetical protein